MAKKQKSTPAPADGTLKNVSDYRFPEATRKNNPPAKIAAEGYVPLIPKAEYWRSAGTFERRKRLYYSNEDLAKCFSE